MGIINKKTLKYAKIFNLFIAANAFIYLFIWMSQFISARLFRVSMKIFGLLPNIFDHLFNIEIINNNRVIRMGCVYSTLFCVIFSILLIKFIEKKENQEKIEQQQRGDFIEEQKLKKIQYDKAHQNKIQKIKDIEEGKKKIDNEFKINTFYCLIEFNIKLFNAISLSNAATTLKKEYAKIFAKKLQENFPSLKISSTDKIFIVCDDFSIIDELVEGISKLIKIYTEINDKKKIKFKALISLYSSNKTQNKKQIVKNLLIINDLRMYNYILISDLIYLNYLNKKDRKKEVSTLLADLKYKSDFDIFQFTNKII